MDAGRLPVNAVAETAVHTEAEEGGEYGYDDGGNPISSLEELLAMVNGSGERDKNGQWKKTTSQPRGRTATRQPRGERSDANKRVDRRPPRPNCGGDHTKLECTKP